MSLSRYSELAIIATLVAAVLTAGVAGAVSVTDETVPEEGEVGEEVTLEAELTELYSDHEQWKFAATTELQNTEWTVELYSDGEQIDTQTDSGDQTTPLELDQSASDAPDTVVVSVTGEVPEVSSFSYEDGQQFQGLELLGNNGETFEIETYSVDQYSADSREARTAIEDARAAIDDADADEETISEAETHYDDAVAAYDDGNFDAAVEAADEAVAALESEESAEDENATADSAETDDASGQSDADASDADEDDADEDDAAASADDDEGGMGIGTILLYGLGVVALAAVGGGVLYVRQQQQSPNRDPLG